MIAKFKRLLVVQFIASPIQKRRHFCLITFRMFQPIEYQIWQRAALYTGRRHQWSKSEPNSQSQPQFPTNCQKMDKNGPPQPFLIPSSLHCHNSIRNLSVLIPWMLTQTRMESSLITGLWWPRQSTQSTIKLQDRQGRWRSGPCHNQALKRWEHGL